jgi:hypothetical protein
MSDKSLLILITRITGNDEWNDVWNFPKDRFIAFIHFDNTILYSYQDFQQLDLNTQLNADAWVLRGYDYTGMKRQKIHSVLNQIDWQKRNVTLKIHRGGGQSVSAAAFQERIAKLEYENTRALFQQAGNYSIGANNSESNPIVRFARRLQQRLTPAEYKANLQEAIAPLPLHVQVANAMHHLSYVLQPLDIDFQGLQDTNFQFEYWQELTEDYKNGKAVVKLNQTKALIYGEVPGSDTTVETVLSEADDIYEEGAWIRSWTELQQNLVPKNGLPKVFDEILELMKNGSEENLRNIKKYFSSGRNPVHEWVTNIHRTLGEVRDALSARENVPKQ